jgi:hypothetical protein
MASSKVKDQGTQCNAGWAFTTAAVAESAIAIALWNRTVKEQISTQYIIDCSYNNEGCLHGTVYEGLRFL